MNLQYISDHRGKISGVFIPIKEWDTIKEQLNQPDEPKKMHTQELLEAFEQMKMIKQGKMPKPKLDDFLNELREL